MPKITRTNTKGLFQETGKGASGIQFTETAVLTANAAANAFVSSAGITQPAGSLIKRITVICTTTHAADAGHVGVRIGESAGAAEVMVLDADSLINNNAAFAAGKASSTDAVLRAALQGAANLVIVPGKAYSATEKTLFPEVVAAGGNITAGEYKCIVEFVS